MFAKKVIKPNTVLTVVLKNKSIGQKENINNIDKNII